MAYTRSPKHFNIPLREDGTDLILRLPITELDRPRPVYVGKHKQPLWQYCGAFYHIWIDENGLLPPANATRKQLQEHFTKLSKWSWSRNGKPSGGSIRIECPQCSGRITSDRRTRRKTVKPKPESARIEATPALGDGGEILYCCQQSTTTITAEEAGSFQLPHYGTPAWKRSCGFRNPSENVIGMTKGDSGLIHGWCRALGPEAQDIGGLMLVIAHNMGLNRKSIKKRTTPKPRTRNSAKPKPSRIPAIPNQARPPPNTT